MTPFGPGADKRSATMRAESTTNTTDQCPNCGSALGPDYVRVFSPTGEAGDLERCPHCPRPRRSGTDDTDNTDERTVLLREVRGDE